MALFFKFGFIYLLLPLFSSKDYVYNRYLSMYLEKNNKIQRETSKLYDRVLRAGIERASMLRLVGDLDCVAGNVHVTTIIQCRIQTSKPYATWRGE